MKEKWEQLYQKSLKRYFMENNCFFIYLFLLRRQGLIVCLAWHEGFITRSNSNWLKGLHEGIYSNRWDKARTLMGNVTTLWLMITVVLKVWMEAQLLIICHPYHKSRALIRMPAQKLKKAINVIFGWFLFFFFFFCYFLSFIALFFLLWYLFYI
jgi:hypothetical protein